MKKYPKTIYVRSEREGDSEYLLAFDKAEDIDNGDIAIYELKNMAVKKTKVEVIISNKK